VSELPKLLDARAIQAELELRTIDVAYGVMDQLPKIRIGKRLFVDRKDLAAYLDEHKIDKDGTPLPRSDRVA
jgi:hypothetical protein